jgi:RHS repeat-associated protein
LIRRPGTSNLLSSLTQSSTTVRSFSYDGAGNVTADTRGSTTYNYAYNKRNRLAELTIGSTVTADYTYDGLERLAIRTTSNMTPAGTTQYVYDLDGYLIAEADGSGNTLTEYVWVDDMPLTVVANVDTSPTLYFVHADHLNRPIRMTDTSESVVWDAVYNPFGDVNSITGTASNNMRFPGQYFLIEDGLYYNWHRHYDPTIGRYTQPDPLGFVNGPSVYSYAMSRPTIETDPNGLFVAPFPPVIPLLRLYPPLPFPYLGPQNPDNPFVGPQDKDPCAGLRKQLADHEQKLKDYMDDPQRYDNKGILGKGNDQSVIEGRIRNLQRQIENFRNLLKECEDEHGRPNFTQCGPGPA